MAMKPNTKAVLEYLKSVHGEKDVTAADVAQALNLEVKQVNGIFTAALQRKEYGYREETEVQLDDGTHTKVKFLKLTDAGLEVDPDAE